MNIWISLLLLSQNSEGFGSSFQNPRVPYDGESSSSSDESSSTEYDERGSTTTIEKFPHQVTVKVEEEDGNFFCGGFIISNRSIITAAHCVKDKNQSDVQVLAGSTFRDYGIVIKIGEVIVHPGYNATNFDKDVAILITESNISFSDTIRPIELPDQGTPVDEDGSVVVSGWGKLAQGDGNFPDRLMMVNLPVVRRSKCRESYPTVLTENQFCAGYYYLGGDDTCEGDSGGAVVQDGLAVGIVSFGRGCGEAMSPSGNTYVASESVRTFIKENTGV